ncbi:hypothetical protein QQF64_023562 [Cirrhinus molitorella]|uniref:Uncharacterized protein n=1 Tax=Cirrhinus molitorella TaxID=172907 RepID=A0ABR3NJ03_9TELE
MDRQGQANGQGEVLPQGRGGRRRRRGGLRMRGGGIGGRGRGAGRHCAVPNEIRATIIDHVINHGPSHMAEAFVYECAAKCASLYSPPPSFKFPQGKQEEAALCCFQTKQSINLPKGPKRDKDAWEARNIILATPTVGNHTPEPQWDCPRSDQVEEAVVHEDTELSTG